MAVHQQSPTSVSFQQNCLKNSDLRILHNNSIRVNAQHNSFHYSHQKIGLPNYASAMRQHVHRLID